MSNRYQRTNEEVFVEDSPHPRHRTKERILRHKIIKYECQVCGLGPIWNDKPMTLILDHINGVHNDNRLENLRFVCSNCDCQLDTYKSKNRKK
jgi:ribosomal protein L44E